MPGCFAVYMRGKDDLQVELRVDADAAVHDLELRVLVFKLIRELLRNVVKHSGVQSASVRVRAAAGEITVDTAPGRGCRVTVVFPRPDARAEREESVNTRSAAI